MFGIIQAHQISDHAEIVIRPHMRAKLYRWTYVIFVHEKLKHKHDTVILSSHYDNHSNDKNSTDLLF